MRVYIRVSDGGREARAAVRLPEDRPDVHDELVLDTFRFAVELLSEDDEETRNYGLPPL